MKGEGCNYDEILLSGLKEQILNSKKNKILIILHTSTSLPQIYLCKKYLQFENLNLFVTYVLESRKLFANRTYECV